MPDHCVRGSSCRVLILNRQKIVLAQASTAYKHSLKEVLASPAIASQIKVLSRAHKAIPLSLQVEKAEAYICTF